jgi:hypothetical protein
MFKELDRDTAVWLHEYITKKELDYKKFVNEKLYRANIDILGYDFSVSLDEFPSKNTGEDKTIWYDVITKINYGREIVIKFQYEYHLKIEERFNMHGFRETYGKFLAPVCVGATIRTKTIDPDEIYIQMKLLA